ncbi:MAG: hypothetical protein HN417_02775 [Desulfobacula sp.]|jgi:hypothetical protein|nr:hypothetical protein [Desulfobacula sp.]
MKTNIKYYKAVGITIKVISDFPFNENTFHPKFKLFEVKGPGRENITIYQHFHLPDLSQYLDSSKKEIYKNAQWHIIQSENYWIYKYTPVYPMDIGHPATAIFNKDHSIIHTYSPGIDEKKYKNGCFEALTLFNSDQILFSKLLCNRKGLILHSNGFDIYGNGILITGESGAGKSTLSQMLKNKGFEILCDDRMFIKKNKEFYIYGSWCHGTVPDVSPAIAPLKAILFLEKSKNNSIQKIENRSQILQDLITSLVRPFLSGQEWISTLKTLEEIINSTQCYKTKFDLSGEICELIDELFHKDKNMRSNGC